MTARPPAGCEEAAEPASRGFTLLAYLYMLLWIFISAFVIMFNKFILSFANFPYPIALTTMHMGFCTLVTHTLVRFKVLETVEIPREVFLR